MRKSLLLVLSLLICDHGLAETVFDNLSEPIAGSFWNTTDQIKTAQPFLLGENHTVDSVTVRLNRFGEPEGTLRIEIWNDLDGMPGTLVGQVGSINAEDVVAGGELTWSEHSFETAVSGLTPNEPYHLVISTPETDWDRSNHVDWALTPSATGVNGAGDAQAISASIMNWHTIRDFPIDDGGGPPFPVYFLASIDAVSALLGDFDGDGSLDVDDINLLTEETAGGMDPSFDLTDDGLVDQQDISFWVKDLANSWIGDANIDGEFETADLVTVFEHGKYEKEMDANWSQGDWTGDGRFGSADLIAAFQDGGFERGPSPAAALVPEPGSFVLFLMSICLVMCRRPIARC